MFRDRSMTVSHYPFLMKLRCFFVAEFCGDRTERFRGTRRLRKSYRNRLRRKRARGKQVNFTFRHGDSPWKALGRLSVGRNAIPPYKGRADYKTIAASQPLFIPFLIHDKTS